jgi:hypothetical protein
MRARRRSRCTLCDMEIQPGEIIVEVCGEWVHRDPCALDSGEDFNDDEFDPEEDE